MWNAPRTDVSEKHQIICVQQPPPEAGVFFCLAIRARFFAQLTCLNERLIHLYDRPASGNELAARPNSKYHAVLLVRSLQSDMRGH